MAIKTKDELLISLKAIMGDNQSDEALSFLEDIEDTLNDFSSKTSSSDTENWKEKYQELDNTWRQRYKDRFFGGNSNEQDPVLEAPKPEEHEIPNNPETYDELFTVKEK